MSVSVGFIIAHPSSPSSSYFSLEPKLSSGVVSTVFNRQQHVRLQVLGEVLHFHITRYLDVVRVFEIARAETFSLASSVRWTNAIASADAALETHFHPFHRGKCCLGQRCDVRYAS